MKPTVRLAIVAWLGAAATHAARAQTGKAASGAHRDADSILDRLIRPNPARSLPLGAFGAKLFAAAVTSNGADSNTVLSPLSVGVALSIARFGARGGTAGALDDVLGMSGLEKAAVEQRGADLMSDLARRTDVVLEMANALWLDTSVTLAPAFRASTGRWRSRAAQVPLASPSAVTAVNRWVDSATHRKVKAVLAEPLPRGSRLLITNAVYFKGKWLDEFQKSATVPGDFTLASGERITVRRMSRTGTVAYRHEQGYQMVRLPYRGGKVAMYIVLPDSATSFDAVAQRIAGDGWAPSLTRADVQEVHLAIPRFRSEMEVDLAPLLKRIGAAIALDCDAADFSGMLVERSRAAPVRLCIERAIQKVYINVDEEGTEAVAVTAMGLASSSYSSTIEFIVDRPFLFVLRDESTGTDLFVGRIARP